MLGGALAAGIQVTAGAAWVLRAGTLIYLAAMFLALRLPDQVDSPPLPPATPRSGRRRSRRQIFTRTGVGDTPRPTAPTRGWAESGSAGRDGRTIPFEPAALPPGAPPPGAERVYRRSRPARPGQDGDGRPALAGPGQRGPGRGRGDAGQRGAARVLRLHGVLPGLLPAHRALQRVAQLRARRPGGRGRGRRPGGDGDRLPDPRPGPAAHPVRHAHRGADRDGGRAPGSSAWRRPSRWRSPPRSRPAWPSCRSTRPCSARSARRSGRRRSRSPRR